jgi:hypothetical protein
MGYVKYASPADREESKKCHWFDKYEAKKAAAEAKKAATEIKQLGAFAASARKLAKMKRFSEGERVNLIDLAGWIERIRDGK